MRLRESSHVDIWKWNILGRNQLSPEMGNTRQFWKWHWGAERRRREGGRNRKQEGAGAIRWDFLYHPETLGSVLSGKDFKEKNEIWLRAFVIAVLKIPLPSSSVETSSSEKQGKEGVARQDAMTVALLQMEEGICVHAELIEALGPQAKQKWGDWKGGEIAEWRVEATREDSSERHRSFPRASRRMTSVNADGPNKKAEYKQLPGDMLL